MNLWDLIFPKDLYCIACGRPLPVQKQNGIALCDRCAEKITWVRGAPFATSPGHVYRRGYAAVVYVGAVEDIVRDMKYRNKAWHADTVAALMSGEYFALADPETGELPYYDYILPVPMSSKKKSIRG